MRRHLTVMALCLLFAACVPQTAQTRSDGPAVPESELTGVWRNGQGAYFCLDEDGVLGLPGQTARSGLSWSRQGDVLVLRTLDMPGGEPREDRLGLVRAGASSLELRGPDGGRILWHRSPDAVGRLDGTVMYRERMALPPRVIVSAQLLLRGSDVPVASSLAVESGQGVLPFRLHYLIKDMQKAKTSQGVPEALVRASILHETESLFATPAPVPVRLDQSPEIMLQRTLPGEGDPAPLATPAQFRGTAKQGKDKVTLTLYLEPDGLYLLHRESTGAARSDTVSVGRWRQIDRNHTVQLIRGADEPLAAALRPAGSLLLTTPDAPRGEMELRPAVHPLPEHSFPVEGMFRMKDGHASLTECASGLDFSVQTSGADFPALQAAYERGVQQPGDPLLVVCEGTVRHREGAPLHARAAGGVDDDIHILEITRFVEGRPGKTCAEPYASSPLMQTYWRLQTLSGQPAQMFPDQAEPHLILRDDNQAVGSDGCNNFFMQWKSTGNAIRFTPGGSTLMLCPQGDEQARVFKDTLADVDAWSITGSVLELLKNGRPLATFEAVAL